MHCARHIMMLARTTKSFLDGVPIAIKDEIDCSPYPTTGGTKWLHKVRSCTDDACCVKRLRSCGAMLVGKTNMHELGAGTSGVQLCSYEWMTSIGSTYTWCTAKSVFSIAQLN